MLHQSQVIDPLLVKWQCGNMNDFPNCCAFSNNLFIFITSFEIKSLYIRTDNAFLNRNIILKKILINIIT